MVGGDELSVTEAAMQAYIQTKLQYSEKYLWIAVYLKTFHKTLIPETPVTHIHTHLVASLPAKTLQLAAWRTITSACHIHGNVRQSWSHSDQPMNLPRTTANSLHPNTTFSSATGRLFSRLKDTHWAPLPPPRKSRNTPYCAPQSTCCQLEKWKRC